MDNKNRALKMKEYFSGEKLYGNDFSIAEIEKWFKDEKEAYTNLDKKKGKHPYGYHQLNITCCFRFLPERKFERVLGFGSAYGNEFYPVIRKIGQITIIEPSNVFKSTQLYGVPVSYIKPQVDGSLLFPDKSFDLITCFGTLHHIPNVSKVVRELARCLKPNGYLLIREPIVSMGDWRKPRKGLTKKERGIPIKVFREIIASTGLTVIKKTKCMFPLTKRFYFLGRLAPYDSIRGSAYNSRLAVLLDSVCCHLFSWNTRYHPRNWLHKLRPGALAFVLQKPGDCCKDG